MNAITLDATGVESFTSLTRAEASRVAIIVKAVCDATGVSVSGLTGRRRTARVAHARQLAMTLIRERTDLSLMEIGDLFGRDHGTVIWAIKAVAARRATDPSFARLSLIP